MFVSGKNLLYRILRFSERYTKTDMVYLAHGGFWLSVGQAAGLGIGFFSALAFGNLLDPHTYGIYRYLLSLEGILGVLSLGGLGVAITRAVARGAEGAFREGTMLNLRWGFLLATAAGVGASYYFWNGDSVLGTGLILIGLFSPLIDTLGLYSAYLNGKKEFRMLGIFQTVRALVPTGIVIGTLFLTTNPIFLIFSYFASTTGVVAILYFLTIRRYHPTETTDPDTKRITWHVSVTNSITAFADRIDQILVFHYLGAASLAIYYFSLALPNALLGFLKGVGLLALPKFTERDKKTTKQYLVSKMVRMTLVTLPIAGAYILLSPLFFKAFLPQYTSSIPYSQLYALTILMSGTLPMTFLESQVAIREKYTLSLASSVARLLFVFGGVYWFGIWGAIIARIVSKGFGLLLSLIIIRRV